jgi:hypothetical protein
VNGVATSAPHSIQRPVNGRVVALIEWCSQGLGSEWNLWLVKIRERVTARRSGSCDRRKRRESG